MKRKLDARLRGHDDRIFDRLDPGWQQSGLLVPSQLMPYLHMRDGARLHYYSVGRGQPVVLLHGFAMPAALWLPFVAPLAYRHRFILPDLRGFGFSHRLRMSEPSILDQHANDLADLVDGLHLQDFHLAGLSMGACTALQYQRRYGFARVRGYLHMDQAPCVRNGPDWQYGVLGADQASRFEHWLQLAERLLAHGRESRFRDLPATLRRELFKVLGNFLNYAFHQPHWRALRHFAGQELLMGRVAPMANWPIYIDTLRSYLHDDYDWRPSLPNISVPMTVAIGMQSTMYPAQGQLMIRELVPHAQIVPFENCGHAFPFEAPRKFVRELGRFLKAA
jgi:pimeloyl-ACP methyl ester carboxylesterase